MRKLACSWLLLLAFFLPAASKDLPTAARHSHFQYIYQITNEEALDFLKKGRISPGDVSLFHSKVDSFAFNDPMPQITLAGHYLLVQVIENEVRVELKSVNNTSIHLLNNRRDLSLMVTDLQGASLNHLVVKAGNRVIHFDLTTDTYRERKSNTNGWLTYEYQGHLHIYNLRKSHNQVLLKRIGNFFATKTPAGVFSEIIQLAEFAISIPLDLYKFIDYPYPEDALYVIGEKYAAFFRFGEYGHEKAYSGYMVLNKPQYRPGETVKYKAYLLNQNGRPAKGRANLVIWILRKGKIVLQQIESYAPGGFEGSFVLHDSLDLKLDTRYRISLERPNGRLLFSEYFRYADYELGDIKLSVSEPKSFHFRGQNLELQITGKNENDLPLYDARLEIAVYPIRVLNFFKDQTFLPDTLLKLNLPLEPSAPTPFVIADSLFPEINLNYEVMVTLISHDNQKKENKLRLDFYHKKEELEYRLHDSLITFHFRENGISKEVNATLLYQDQGGLTGESKEVELPYTEKINPGIYQYKLIRNELTETLRPNPNESGIGISEERTHEEVMFRVNNPRNLPFAWFLYKNDQEVSNGEDTGFLFNEPAKHGDNYVLSIHYLWAGELAAQRRNSVFQPGQLSIDVNQPERVFPGQKATIEIDVKDAWGKPAANTDLTAFGWTRKFETSPPNIQGAIHRWHDITTFNTFHTVRPPLKLNSNLARKSEFWFPEAGLDTMSYFQFRFPGKELFTSAIKTFTGETQLAPFLFRNGLEVPIHMVYVNHKPVYSSLANNARPWSFRGEPGYNHLRIRTRNNEIVIDSLFLEAGKKTFVSLDLNKNKSISMQRARPKISRQEKALIFRQLFAFELPGNTPTWIDYEDGIVFLNKGGQNHFSYGYWNTTITGPLLLDTARVSSTGNPLFKIPLDHRVKHWIGSDGIKEVQPFEPDLFPRTWWGFGGNLRKLNEEFLTLSLFEENQRIRQESAKTPRFVYNNPRATKPENGTLSVIRAFEEAIIKKYGDPIHVVLWPESSTNLQIYPGPQFLFHDVSEGNYFLVYIFKENHYIKTEPFFIKGRGQNYIRFNFRESPVTDVEIEKLVSPRLKSLMTFPFAGSLGIFSPVLFQRPESISPAASISENISFGDKYERGELESYDIARGNFLAGFLQGRVFDASDNSPLPGVTITIRGTSTGVVTDLDGNFSINVSPGQILVVSFIGMKTHEFRAVNETHIVYLAPETLALEEVIVVGYGTRSQLSLSGATSGIMIRGISGIYGSRAADSEVMFMVVDDEILPPPPPDQIDITSSLQAFVLPDFAGWEPGAQSGSIRSNFSDYAHWQPRLRTDAKGKASFEVTFPDDVTYWDTFIYAMNEKRQSGRHIGGIQSFQALMAQLSLPRFLVQGDTAYAIGRVTSYLQDTLNVETNFELAGQEIRTVAHLMQQTAIDTLLLTATTLDSLQVKYHLEYNGFVDGEERKIPIMPQGLEKTIGKFWSLKADSTFSVSFDQTLGEVSLYAKSNPLELFLDDIERLIRFPYNCNEQEASRLIALLAKKEIYAFTGKRFWQEGRIRSTINELVKNQNSEGFWGWWGNSPHSSIWMSEHVLKALQMASEKGYEVNYSRPITSGMLAFYGEKNLPQRERASLIRIMLMHGYEAEYDKMIRQLAAQDTYGNLFYELAELNQLADVEQPARALLDSAKHTFFGNMYFAGRGNPMSFWENTGTNTLAAYRIFNRAGKTFQQYLEPIFGYLLEVRDVSFPSSTYFSSNMVYSIMPTLVEMAAASERAARLELSGSVDSLADEFPLELRFSPEKALQVTKTGASPVYLTTYQRYWEGHPTAESGDIKVHSWFEGSEANKLEAAKEVTLKVTVTLEKPAEYLMLEVPIPAGCSYAENQPRGTGEMHREQWRHQTTLFFNRLGPGTYTYEIKLLPRFSGTYTLNPAKAELMYFPVFNANNEMRKVVIE